MLKIPGFFQKGSKFSKSEHYICITLHFNIITRGDGGGGPSLVSLSPSSLLILENDVVAVPSCETIQVISHHCYF